MKKRSRQGLRRLRVEVRSWGNYVERIAALERVLARKPTAVMIELVGIGEIPADAVLRFRAALMERCPKTRIVTNARSSLQGASVLLWLLGDTRTIREDAQLFFRPTKLSESNEVSESDVEPRDESEYSDSSSSDLDPEEGDYARVLKRINEFLPVREMAGRFIGAPVLRQFGLIGNEKMDDFLAGIFSKQPQATKQLPNGKDQAPGPSRATKRARQIRG